VLPRPRLTAACVMADTTGMSDAAQAVPIACSLSAAANATRKSEWTALLDRALIGRRRVNGGMRVELKDLPYVGVELEGLLAAERDCCRFLTLTIEKAEAAVALTVTAPRSAAALLGELFAQDRGDARGDLVVADWSE
jgi:hypothetical protein